MAGENDKKTTQDGIEIMNDGHEEARVTDPNATEQASQAVRDTQAGTKGSVERPDYLPEKFWTGDLEESHKKMAEAYAEAQKKISGGDTTTTTTTTTESDSTGEKGSKETDKDGFKITPPDESDSQQQQVKEIDFGKAEEEYVENNGQISDATYEEYAKWGISRHAIDNYIAGEQAKIANMQSKLTEITGGADEMKTVLQWAHTNLDQETQKVYNDAVDSGNTAQAALAMQGIMAAYVAKNGSAPNLIDGERGGESGVGKFDNVAQMTAAMKDSRYQTDPAYREKVIKRIAASDL